MALVLITGISTSGKSTVAKELSKRGLEAYDTEHNGISAWFNKDTGSRDAEFGKVPERTIAWFDSHEWRISMEWVHDINARAKDHTVFLCGGGANEAEVRALCGAVIWLQTDETTIRKRVNIPRDHTYGTKPHELEAAIRSNIIKEAEYRNLGAAVVDARQPTGKVVDEILKIARQQITDHHYPPLRPPHFQ
jgi:shikimate kinase